MTPTNARKTKSAAIPTSVPMKNSDTPYEDQMIMNNKKIIGKQFYPLDKGVPETPFQNGEKQPKRKRVKQSKGKRVKSSNQQDETQREVAEELKVS